MPILHLLFPEPAAAYGGMQSQFSRLSTSMPREFVRPGNNTHIIRCTASTLSIGRCLVLLSPEDIRVVGALEPNGVFVTTNAGIAHKPISISSRYAIEIPDLQRHVVSVRRIVLAQHLKPFAIVASLLDV